MKLIKTLKFSVSERTPVNKEIENTGKASA
jgi:hypothetical protein